MKTRLWIVLLIVVAWTSFLIGYSVSALTGVKRAATEVTGPGGGYGGASEGAKAEAGGYGGAAGRSQGKAGGYGGSAGDSDATPAEDE